MSDVKDKLIKSEVIRNYFLNKKHKRLGFFKYTKKKIGNFLKDFWEEDITLYTILSNVVSFGYSGLFIGAMSSFGVQDVKPFLVFSLILPVMMLFLSLVEDEEITIKSVPIVATIISSLLYYCNSDVESLKYAFYICAALMNGPLIITLLAIPLSVISSLFRVIFNRKSMISMEANLEIEDHEVISQVLKREEFSYFLENYKKHSDMPLNEMKEYIKKMDAKKEALLQKQKSEELKILKKEKLENYADSFYNKEG